jgi:hypothetical protein
MTSHFGIVLKSHLHLAFSHSVAYIVYILIQQHNESNSGEIVNINRGGNLRKCLGSQMGSVSIRILEANIENIGPVILYNL